MDIDYSVFASLKGEFEAEGLTRVDVAAEALFAARQGKDYLVKISGAEAKSDVFYLADIGITSLVCPMVETAFAMEKYMEMLPQGAFEHVGVTIETITAVANIDAILAEGKSLSEVTIGRTDLTASYKGDSVESDRTVGMVKTVARAAKAKGLKVTMGGSVSKHTRELLQTDAELRGLLDYVETRKAVMPVERFLEESALTHALKLEEVLLRRRARESERTLPAVNARLAALTKRA
ncbi:aldolase/citrate lyase family protein [Roseateles chitosanitabidus]|uniref:aldolase/citrate lyase family protein n=1 Tax=Roseateles chitosanitabidus TaxID=65048 RepID=UPI000835426A|nr:aldolase/citrate lyase family protein [Roseateles chitosanitabidus]